MHWRHLFTTPNLLSLGRIVAIPFIVAALDMTSRHPQIGLIAAFLMGLAGISDILDGYFARKYRDVSTLGKLLDPVADKMIVAAALIMLVQLDRVPAWLAILMILRELYVNSLRGIAAASGTVIAAETLGKIKTVCQFVGLIAFMVGTMLPILPHLLVFSIAWGGVLVAAGFSLISAVDYTRRYLAILRG